MNSQLLSTFVRFVLFVMEIHFFLFFSRCFVGFNTFASCTRYSLSLSLDVIMQIAKKEKSLEITSVISNVLLSKGPCVQGFVSIVSNTS